MHFLRMKQTTQLAFILLLYVGCFSSPRLYVILLYFSHDRSKLSSPPFSCTTFKKFAVIYDLFTEVSSFSAIKLCSKCLSQIKSNLLAKRVLVLLNGTFVTANLDLISLLHDPLFVIMLPKGRIQNTTFLIRRLSATKCLFIYLIFNTNSVFNIYLLTRLDTLIDSNGFYIAWPTLVTQYCLYTKVNLSYLHLSC